MNFYKKRWKIPLTKKIRIFHTQMTIHFFFFFPPVKQFFKKINTIPSVNEKTVFIMIRLKKCEETTNDLHPLFVIVYHKK